MRWRTVLLLLLLSLLPAHSGEGEVALLTDEAIPRYLERGRELAKARQWEKMCDVLQRVIAGDPAIFPDLKPDLLNAAVHSTDGVLYEPARELCLRELSKLPPEGLAAYRALFDRTARDVLEAAQNAATMDARLAGYAAVYEPYLVSSVGDDALEAAADILLDLGRHDEALALLRRLLDVYPREGCDRDLPMDYAKAAYCAARLGNATMRAALLRNLASNFPDAKLRIEGRTLRPAEVEALPMFAAVTDPGLVGDGDWASARGNAAGTGIGEDLPDSMPGEPLWRHKIEERDARLVPRGDTWVPFARDRAPSALPSSVTDRDCVQPYPTIRPIVMDGVVYYKDGREVVARLAGSGEFVLFSSRDATQNGDGVAAPGPISLGLVRPDAGSRDAQQAQWIEEVYRFLDYGGHAVCGGGGFLVSVEWEHAPQHLRAGADAGTIPSNTLAAYGRADGKISWGWSRVEDLRSETLTGDPALVNAWKRDWLGHQFAVFCGPGIIDNGVLYTLAQEQEDGFGTALWAFRIEDGRVLFRTQLHHRDTIDRIEPGGAALAVSGGVVYAITGAGVVAAVDALAPGRIRWIRRYPRAISSGGRGGPPRLAPRLAYNEPIVSGGLVLCAPEDGKQVFALEAETGRLAWEIPLSRTTGSVHQVLGVSGGVLVLSGYDVVGIDVAKGEVLWGPYPLPLVRPYGRGYVGRRFAYVPTTLPRERRARILRFDLWTGKAGEPLLFNVDRLGNLLAVGGRLLAAGEDEILCFGTEEAESASLERRLNGSGPRSAIYFERALLALLGEAPRRADAAADFKRAIEAARGERAILTGLYERAINNLLEIARDTGSVAPIEEARALARELSAEDRGAGLRLYEAQTWLSEIEVLAAAGRSDESLARMERFPIEFPREKVVVGGATMSAAAAARTLRQSLLSDAGFAAAFSKRVRARIDAAVAKGDLAELEAIPLVYDHEPPTEESTFALARLLEEKGELPRAELALKSIIEGYPEHPRCAEAQLEVARILLSRGLVAEGRRWRDRAVARIDEAGRARLAPLIQKINEALTGAGKIGLLPRLALPLATKPLAAPGFFPVAIRGDLPEGAPDGFTLLADDAGYLAMDGAGTVLWRAKGAAGQPVPPGPPGSPDTAALAAAVAAATDAFVVGSDLVLGDVAGMMRVDLASGEVRWRRPSLEEHAAALARDSIGRLAEDLSRARREGVLARGMQLPSHALAGSLVLRLHPGTGLEACAVATGALAWQDVDTKGATLGALCVEGQLIAAGWAAPALVKVYDLEGNELCICRGYGAEPGVLLAPPVLDPLGRLFVVTASDAQARDGSLRILSARDGSPASEIELPVRSPHAAVLYADGSRVVFHDGGAGAQSLHFVDLSPGGQVVHESCEALLRDYHVVRDGQRIFVLTFTLGVRDGARLFRIDTESKEALPYEYPPLLRAYARPVLTQRYVAVTGSDARESHVRLYDREATTERRAPSDVFALPGGSGLTDRLTFEAPPGGERARFSAPTAIAASGAGLVVSGPFGIYRLASDAPR